MERVVQLFDEIDEWVGLLCVGAWANGRRMALQAVLVALAVFAVLFPV